MVAEEKEKKELMYWGIGLVILFVIFVVLRVVWQKGGRPLGDLSKGVQGVLSIVVLVVTFVAVYYIQKMYRQ